MSKYEKRIGFNDWFGRDADYGYTHYDPTKRSIGWDRGYTNYSDFFFGKGAKVDMSEAAALIRTMCQVMGISRNKFSAGKRADTIALPTQLLADAGTDVFIGAALQNIAAYTHQDESERSYAHKVEGGKINLNNLIKKVLNDERIGKLMSEDTPGYLRFIQKYKEHRYKSRPAYTNDNQHLVDLFERIISYPDQITEEELDKFKDAIAEIKELIKKSGGIPEEMKKCNKLANQITQSLEKYMKNDESSKSESDSDGGSEEGDDSDSETGDSGTEGFTTKGGGMSKEDERFLEKMMESMKIEGDSESSSFKHFIEEMQFLEESSSAMSDIHSKVDIIPIQETKRTKANYARALKKVDVIKANVIGTLLRRKSRNYQFVAKSMRSGRLDTNKLCEAVQGVDTIYERVGHVRTDKLCVGILVDESGSMAGDKANAAREAAIFLNEALRKVPDVELFIYGHTADWIGDVEDYPELTKLGSGHMHTQLFVYSEPGKRHDTALGAIEGRWENRDGTAILAAVTRMRKFTQNNGVLVVISDGSPHAKGYSGEKAKNHVKKSALMAEQMGFEVIQVTIGGYRSKEMFRNVINMDSVESFPEKFVGFLRKKVNSLIKEKTVM